MGTVIRIATALKLSALLLLPVGLIGLLPLAAASQEPSTAPTAPPAEIEKIELHRLRITNRKDGPIQVSTDEGRSWQLIGRVVAPAITVAPGYIAAEYAAPGTVAATAVHGIRLRTGGDNPNGGPPQVLGIEPAEHTDRKIISGEKPNKGFGGYVSGAAGIFTDIPAGSSLFRELAPYVGNPVYLQSGSGRLLPLPASFSPVGEGETLVIRVLAVKNSLVSLTMENRRGGVVEATFADGSSRQITGVARPVLGVGRFDGTAYTGVGRLNTAHTGVLTVSTAPLDRSRPEGVGREQRGGFQISPIWHNSRTEEAGAPQVMTLGSGEKRREWEGLPPLFRDMVGLDATGANIEVSIDGGPWEPMPAIIGLRPSAFTGPGLTAIWKEQDIRRRAQEGVTAFRFVFTAADPARSAAMAQTAAESYRERRLAVAKAGRMPIVSGVLTINANPGNTPRVSMVRFSVEGVPRGFTNVAPFALSWDTTRVPDGDYLVEAEAMDEAGVVIATSRRRVYVQNTSGPPQTGAQATMQKP